MFGRGWEYGQARIVEMRPSTSFSSRFDANSGLVYDYVADVVPADGSPPFRATFTGHFGFEVDYVLGVGDEARVRYREGGEHVKLDPDFMREREKEMKESKRASFEATASASPGAPKQSAPAPGPQPTVRVTTSTDPADIQRMRERLERAAAENPGSVVRFQVGEPGGASTDVVGQLERLAKLHESGALTDAEFAAEKAKLIGGS